MRGGGEGEEGGGVKGEDLVFKKRKITCSASGG